MPTLEVRKRIEPQEAVQIARSLAAAKLGEESFVAPRTLLVTLDPGHMFLVEHVLVFACSPHGPSIECGEVPVMIVCPYCRRDVLNIFSNPHAAGCPRPSFSYSHAECGQPDYDRDY